MKHSLTQWLHKVHPSRTKNLGNGPVSSLPNQEILKYEFILNAMTDGVMIINADQIIISLNDEAAAITGWPKAEALGLNYHSVVQPITNKNTSTPQGQDIIDRTLVQGKPLRDGEASLVSRSGKNVSVSISVSPLLNDQKQVSAVVVVIQDVSQERQAQQQRAEFISTASHEMRTPVAAIEGYLSLALNNKVSYVDDKAREYLEKARASTQSLGKLFQDLLTSSRVEDGRLTSHPEIIEMGDYLTKLVEELRFAVTKKNLKLALSIGSGEIIGTAGNTLNSSNGPKTIRPLYYVEADPDRLREVITNLFDNAIKYTEQGGISIGLTGDASVVQFSIRDTGAGIPAEDILHLFQKFYRVDNSATRTVSGTGLGLFISRKIVELYNGRIWVESDLGHGSTFYINLPRISTQKAAARQITNPLATMPQAATTALVHS